jgi:hypothetical protein
MIHEPIKEISRSPCQLNTSSGNLSCRSPINSNGSLKCLRMNSAALSAKRFSFFPKNNTRNGCGCFVFTISYFGLLLKNCEVILIQAIIQAISMTVFKTLFSFSSLPTDTFILCFYQKRVQPLLSIHLYILHGSLHVPQAEKFLNIFPLSY